MYSILSYALLDMMYYVENVPTHGWWILLTVLPQPIPAVTLVPRLVFSLRELYARDAYGTHGGEIDTAFGLSSASGHGAVASTIIFADTWQNERSGGGELPMEEVESRSASSSGA